MDCTCSFCQRARRQSNRREAFWTFFTFIAAIILVAVIGWQTAPALDRVLGYSPPRP